MTSISRPSVEMGTLRQIAAAGFQAAILAAAVNGGIWIVGDAAGGMRIPLVAPIMSSVIGIVIGGLIFALLVRLTRRPETIFTIIGIAFLVLYAVPPIAALNGLIPNVPTFNVTTVVATELMHLVAGAAAIGFYKQALRPLVSA